MNDQSQAAGRIATVALLAWAALLVLAPPANDACWGVNGFRSVSPLARVILVALAAAAPAALLAKRAPRAVLALAAVALAAVLAFITPEAMHLGGDTASRGGSIAAWAEGVAPRPWHVWAANLHAQPLDLVTGLFLPGWLVRRTGDWRLALGLPSALAALAYAAGAWRVAKRLAAPGEREPSGENAGTALALWIALLAWGGLLAFAGYAESAGVALAAGMWWWSAMLAPLSRRRDGLAIALAWLALVASHRLGLALVPAMGVRLLAPPAEGDTRDGRRTGLAAAVVAIALAAAWFGAAHGAGGSQLASDVRELLRWPEPDVMASVPTDLANLALLLAPLAFVALLFAGPSGAGAALGDPRGLALAAAVVALLPTAFPLPLAPSGLGVQRDWDLGALLGLSLTVAGAFTLARAGTARLRAALRVALPVLVLGAGSWVAVNADLHASGARARAMLEGSPPLGARHRSALLLTLGTRATQLGRMSDAAAMLEESWRLVPSPARGLHATLAWMSAGRWDDARRTLAAVRERGGLNAKFTADADTLAAQIARLSGDGAAPH